MANPLLDFVMSLVRDPDAAAHYAADPAGAIDAAHLTDVTSADVNALIPVVADSLSTAAPTTGADLLAGDPGGNVWSSGAATAAFDAFDDHVSVPAVDDAHSVVANVIDEPEQSVHAGLDAVHDAGIPAVADFDDPSAQLTGGVIDDAPLTDDAGHADWQPVVDDIHHHLDTGLDHGDTGLDLFD
ncbi:hypothetical protein DVS77_30095 [Mycolicibacterium moriokaense]|nr:hypothetical protein DVS77_30095 [Mycolicibacterium moriokaense]